MTSFSTQEHLERLELRDALTKSRRALEVLTKGKVWNFVNRHGDGNLKIKLRSAKAPIELRNLTEQLKQKINVDAFVHENKVTVLEPINTLLGIDGDSREWRYLNKGVHEEEDRDEFDRGVVLQIVDSLSSLDSAFR